MMCVYKKFHNL